MRHTPVRTTLAVGLVVGIVLPLWGQAASQGRESAVNPFTGDAKAVTQGAVLFRQECVFCHGVSARGGMRGPDLTTGAWSHGGADGEVAATILGGVPGTAMPANNLTPEEIWQIVAYLRTVQQPTTSSTGDASRGQTLFAGGARCASCHIVHGRGGRVGPELTTVGSSRSRAYLVESIREPARYLTENPGTGEAGARRYDAVTAVTNDGRTIVGVAMNEDTFTVQILDMGEQVHSLTKRDLKSLRHEERSLMPAYGVTQLNDVDLADVVAYLQTLRAPTPARRGGPYDHR